MITSSQIRESTEFLRKNIFIKPKAAIILGTGLNDLPNYIHHKKIIAFREIPHFPVSTVEYHKGQLIFGILEDLPVLVMQGRFHYYEGYSMQLITLPVRVMKELGVEYLLLSNAAGGINPKFKRADLVITEDHINLLPDNPLRGIGDTFGNRFVDMSEPYDKNLQNILEKAFISNHVPVKKGVYAAVMGPNLETRAEYRWLKSTGADMVGMSTVPEIIVANQLVIKSAAISVITDECDPDNLQKINIGDIIEAAGKADIILSKIVSCLIIELKKIIKD
jgi:purine-nucleoside phosphorylase